MRVGTRVGTLLHLVGRESLTAVGGSHANSKPEPFLGYFTEFQNSGSNRCHAYFEAAMESDTASARRLSWKDFGVLARMLSDETEVADGLRVLGR
jgi:hypothetical protein